MSDRVAWLEQWCPECRAAPGARCRQTRFSRNPQPSARMHCARGWRERPCPTCKAPAGETCRTPSGRFASQPHAARLRPARRELVAISAVWDELERRGAAIAVVPFCGRAGRGGEIGTVVLSRSEDGELVAFDRRTALDEVAQALAAPVWDRYGTFAGQPSIRGTVTWSVAARRIVIAGRHGDASFEELVA